MIAETRQGLGQKLGLASVRAGIVDALTGPVLEDLTQWMVVTNVGVLAKVLLEASSALRAGTSFETLLECLQGI